MARTTRNDAIGYFKTFARDLVGASAVAEGAKSDPADETQKAHVRLQQYDLLHRSLPGAAMGSSAAVILIALLQWNNVSGARFVWWLVCIGVSVAAQYVMYFVLLVKRARPPYVLDWRGIRLLWPTFIMEALCWGVAPVLWIPDGVAALSLSLVIIAALVAGAAFYFAVHLPTMLIYEVPLNTTLVIALLYRGGYENALLAVGFLCLLLAVMSFGVNLNRTVKALILANLRNEYLASDNLAQKQTIQTAFDRQTAFNEILRAMSSSISDVGPALRTIARHACGLCAAKACHIYLLAESGPVLKAQCSDGWESESVPNCEAVAVSLVKESVASGKVIHVSCADEDRERRDRKSAEEIQILALPFEVPSQKGGALLLFLNQRLSSDSTEQDLLSALADQARLAWANAALVQALSTKSEQLETANRHKSTFISRMSHELRTPLNAIIGFSDMMKNGLGGKLAEKQHDFVLAIHSAGVHLLSLVNDLLDLAKIEAGRMELSVQPFEVGRVVEKTVELIQHRISMAGLTLSCKIVGNEREFQGDVRMFKQILLNLLSNAAKFSHRGGSIALDVLQGESDVMIIVRDEGVGIESERLPQLFGEYQQLGDDVSTRREGTGLGLTIVKRFVEICEGSISVESSLGKGSTFSVRLPQLELGERLVAPR